MTLGAWLLVAPPAAAGDPHALPGAPAATEGAAAAAPKDRSWHSRLPLPRFRWGLPEIPSEAMEAERDLFGFHLHFDFGPRAARRRDAGLR